MIFFQSISMTFTGLIGRKLNKRSSVLTGLARLLYDMMRMLIFKAVNLPSPYKVTETQFPYFNLR